MTLQQLMYYVTTAECGNITEAAERLFISQPSLSNAIHNLEKEMGIVAFARSNKGVVLTRDGEELLSFSRMLLEQADIMKEHFGTGEKRTPKFSVSCQHYSFAVNAFVDLIKEYDADQYSFIIRETQTGEIIDDVAGGRSEIGIIYLSENNEEVLSKMLKKNELVFEELFIANPHVFICKEHPLAKVSGDKKVVLGLITTKSPKLEDKQLIIDRIHDAAKYIPLDRLYLSPQCGFASCEIGNKLTEEEQWAKLKLVKEIATEVWG